MSYAKYIMKVLKTLFMFILVVLVIINMLGLLVGLTASGLFYVKPCLKKPSRLEKYAVPAVKLGCFLGAPEGVPYYYEKADNELR